MKIKAGEMKDEKIIIIINVDLRSLVGTPTVFDIQGMEVEVVFQVLQVFFRRAYDVVPPQGTYFYRINHNCSGLKMIIIKKFYIPVGFKICGAKIKKRFGKKEFLNRKRK
jgi:hypothetical protein